MAKISEMTDDVLVKYISAYKKKVDTGVDLEKNSKLLSSLKKEQSKRDKIDSVQEPIAVHHTSDIDYSDYENASFNARTMAFFIDGIILGIGNQILVACIVAITKSSVPPEFKIFTVLVQVVVMIGLPTT